MRQVLVLGIVVTLMVLGCRPPTSEPKAGAPQAPQRMSAAEEFEPAGEGRGQNAPQHGQEAAFGRARGAEAVEETAPKIIHNGRIELVVDDLDEMGQALDRLVTGAKGYVARSETSGSPGSPRSAFWHLRVPVARYSAFLSYVAKLGEVTRNSTDSDDITDKYYDLAAHIKNDQVEEEGLQKLLLDKTASGKLEDLLAIRRELRTVRGQIEMEKSQMQRWDKLTQLGTVILTAQERKGYVPPESPTFNTTLGRTFQASLDALTGLGKVIALIAVALVPWLPILVLALVLGWLALRRSRRREPLPVAAVSGP
jgi:hypothetical protein